MCRMLTVSIAAGIPRDVATPAMAAFGIIPVPHSGCASPSAGRHYDLAEIWALITPHPHIVTRELYPNSAEMGRDPRRSALSPSALRQSPLPDGGEGGFGASADSG